MAEGLILAVMGIGTVFCALLLLTLFTTGFNFLFTRQAARTSLPGMDSTPAPATAPVITAAAIIAPPAASPPAQRARSMPYDEQLTEKRRKAAAIAVALLLAAGSRPAEVFHPCETEGAHWRLGYRQQFLHGGGRRQP